MKLTTLAIALATGIMTMATAASALPMPGAASALPAQAEASLPVELAHGCHRNIQRDYSGWHFHSGACVRRPTAPPGLHDYYANRRYYRAPLCTYRCKQVGPVKSCQQVCR